MTNDINSTNGGGLEYNFKLGVITSTRITLNKPNTLNYGVII